MQNGNIKVIFDFQKSVSNLVLALNSVTESLETMILNSPEALFEAEDQDLVKSMLKYEDQERYDMAICYRNELLRRGADILKLY